MDAKSTGGQLPQHTPEFLKERKFLVVMPLLILPFLTMAFWALGGGKQSNSAFDTSYAQGLNTTLPQAQFKDQKAQDKMGIYQTVKTDSASSAGSGVSESFIQSMGLDASKDGHADAVTQQSTVNLTGGPTSAEVNEAKIQAKLAAINQQINQPEPANYGVGASSSQSNADIKRLEMMMKAMNGNNSGTDPEMRQLTQMLQQINDLQNPGNANERLRNQSIKNRGRVYAVTSAGEDDENVGSYTKQISYTSFNGDKSKKSRNSTAQATGNTIQAVIHEDQTLVSGAVIKLRLLDGIYVNGKQIPKGSFVYGTCALNNERLDIKIASIRYLNNILPVALTVYDLDGMPGLYVPGSIGRDAAKNGVGEAVQSMQIMSMDQSVGAQAASAGVEAAKGLFNRKVKQIKVKVKAGYEVLLKDSNDRDN